MSSKGTEARSVWGGKVEKAGRNTKQPGGPGRVQGRARAGRASRNDEAERGCGEGGLPGRKTHRHDGNEGKGKFAEERRARFLLRAQLTEETAAKPVPHAARVVPDPAVPQAGHEVKGDPEDGHQQIAEADVDQEEVGGGAEPPELVVEDEHQQVVADAQQSDGAQQQGQALVGALGEQRRRALRPRWPRSLHARRSAALPETLAATAVPRVHGPTTARSRVEAPSLPRGQQRDRHRVGRGTAAYPASEPARLPLPPCRL